MKNKPNYAFIDSNNLYLGVKSEGWTLDYAKFRLYLKNKYNVDKAFLFIGMIDKNKKLYDTFERQGYTLIFKPTVRYFENGEETRKGNVDAELVLHSAAIQYKKYDKAVIVSGDGDFACLVEYLKNNGKLLNIMVPNERFSSLLRRFNQYIVRIDLLQKNLSHKKIRITKKIEINGRSKP